MRAAWNLYSVPIGGGPPSSLESTPIQISSQGPTRRKMRCSWSKRQSTPAFLRSRMGDTLLLPVLCLWAADDHHVSSVQVEFGGLTGSSWKLTAVNMKIVIINREAIDIERRDLSRCVGTVPEFWPDNCFPMRPFASRATMTSQVTMTSRAHVSSRLSSSGVPSKDRNGFGGVRERQSWRRCTRICFRSMHRHCHRLLLTDVTCSCKGWNEHRALLCNTRRHPQTRVVIFTREGHARDRGRSSWLTVQDREGHAWIMVMGRDATSAAAPCVCFASVTRVRLAVHVVGGHAQKKKENQFLFRIWELWMTHKSDEILEIVFEKWLCETYDCCWVSSDRSREDVLALTTILSNL